jgi:hypothetical protein
MRSAMTAVALAAGAVGLTGCPADSCPLEAPQVSAVPTSCTEVAGQPVSFPVRLCPTCNQSGATCVADMSAVGTSGDIFLDIKVEACTGSSSCPPACQLNAITCTFNAPASPGPYKVLTFDGATGNTNTSQLVVIAQGAESCALPTAGI